jgi:hypothetical protein
MGCAAIAGRHGGDAVRIEPNFGENRRVPEPLISPSKAWEGRVGGVASATTLGVHGDPLDHDVHGMTGGPDGACDHHDGLPRRPRNVGDRLDPVVFAAPAFVCLTCFGWT